MPIRPKQRRGIRQGRGNGSGGVSRGGREQGGEEEGHPICEGDARVQVLGSAGRQRGRNDGRQRHPRRFERVRDEEVEGPEGDEFEGIDDNVVTAKRKDEHKAQLEGVLYSH